MDKEITIEDVLRAEAHKRFPLNESRYNSFIEGANFAASIKQIECCGAELKTLKRVKDVCKLYSDSSARTLGYNWVCAEIKKLEENPVSPCKVDELRKALEDLVRLKEIKDRLDKAEKQDEDFHKAMEWYRAKKILAWEKAKQLLK